MPSANMNAQGLGRGFAALLRGTVVTNLGDGLRLTAFPLLAVSLTSSPLLIGALTATQFLPWTTFAPFGGVIVDRSDRRRLIMVTQTWRAALIGLLGLVIATGRVEIWHLFVTAYLITAGEILVDPSVVATVPTLVSKEQLDRANSQISTVEVVTNNFLGGPIGAACFALAPWLPFVLDACSYQGSVVPFSKLPPSAPRAVPAEGRPSARAEISEGARWIWNHAFLRPLTLAFAVFHLGTAGVMSLLILMVTDVLAASEITYGVALAFAAGGATLATLAAARLTDRFKRGTVMTVAGTVTAASVLATAIVQAPWQLVAIGVLNGAGGGVLLSIGRGFIQRHTPNDRLGRTAIASRMISRSSFVVGALAAGAVASLASVRWAFALAGVLHLLGAALFWRAFRREPQ